MNGIFSNRRQFMQATTAASLLALFGGNIATAQAAKIILGTALTQEGGAVVLRMEHEKLLEQAAKEIGLESVNVEYLEFTVLLRMLQGLVAGQLEMGMLGSTPLIRSLSGEDPAVPIALAGGGNRFPIQVPADSNISNMDDLKGKTVLTIVGSDIHLVFARMLKAHFGTESPEDLGITLRNINALTELGEPQADIDAVVSMEPISTTAENKGTLKTILYNDGKTGAGYDGPAGRGAGHTVDFFSKTPFSPEAFYPHRVWWVVRRSFLEENPKVVQAFQMASARAVDALAAMDPGTLVDTYGQKFPGTREAQVDHISHVLWRRRGWPWICKGDIQSLIGLSRTKALFEKELDAENVRAIVAKGAEVTEASWKAIGKNPELSAFTPTDDDLRGSPVWEIDSWDLVNE